MPRRRLISKAQVQFTAVDQTFVGTYVGMDLVPFQSGDKMLKKYSFQNEMGTFVLMGTMQIDEAMDAAREGDVVEVTYKGTVPTSNGFQVKLFEIAVLDEGDDVEE